MDSGWKLKESEKKTFTRNQHDAKAICRCEAFFPSSLRGLFFFIAKYPSSYVRYMDIARYFSPKAILSFYEIAQPACRQARNDPLPSLLRVAPLFVIGWHSLLRHCEAFSFPSLRGCDSTRSNLRDCFSLDCLALLATGSPSEEMGDCHSPSELAIKAMMIAYGEPEAW